MCENGCRRKPPGKIATVVCSQSAIISHMHANTARFFTFACCVIITVLVVACFMAASREQSEAGRQMLFIPSAWLRQIVTIWVRLIKFCAFNFYSNIKFRLDLEAAFLLCFGFRS